MIARLANSRGARSRLALFAVVALALVCCLGPILLFRGPYYSDWSNHLFAIDQQRLSIRDTGWPSFILNTGLTGLLYPFALFYGGTLYATGGYLAAVLGSAEIAYVVLWTAAFLMAMGGLIWLAHLAGVRTWLAAVPAVVFVSSAYWLTNVYGRGAFPELLATSALPLSIAAGTALIHSGRVRTIHMVAFVIGAIALTGSHNVTALWSCTFVVIVIAGWLLAGGKRYLLRRPRRWLLVGGLAALALGINAWFLLPDLMWATQTQVYGTSSSIDTDATGFFNAPEVVLSPWRYTPSESSTPDLLVQLPVVAGVAFVAVVLLMWRSLGRGVRCLAIAGGCATAVYSLLFMVYPLWHLVPSPFKTIQFQYRLSTYATLGVALIGIAAMRAVCASPVRLLRWLALSVIVLSLAQAGTQAWRSPTYPEQRATGLAPGELANTWYATTDYRMTDLPVLDANRDLPLDPASVVRGRVTLPPGTPSGTYQTNVAASRLIAGFGSVEILGRDPSGFLVIRGGPESGGLATHAPWPVLLGRVVTVVSALGLVAVLLTPAIRRRRPLGVHRED